MEDNTSPAKEILGERTLAVADQLTGLLGFYAGATGTFSGRLRATLGELQAGQIAGKIDPAFAAKLAHQISKCLATVEADRQKHIQLWKGLGDSNAVDRVSSFLTHHNTPWRGLRQSSTPEGNKSNG